MRQNEIGKLQDQRHALLRIKGNSFMRIQHIQCLGVRGGGNHFMVSVINGLCDIAVYDVNGYYDIAVCVMLQFVTSGTGLLAIWVYFAVQKGLSSYDVLVL